MRKSKFIIYVIAIVTISLIFQSCKQEVEISDKGVSVIPIDSAQIAPFLKNHPDLKKYENNMVEIYRHFDFNYIWLNERGVVDYGDSLYSKVENIRDEGIYSTFPYQENIDSIFTDDSKKFKKHPDSDFLMTGLYLFYADKVYRGIDSTTSKKIGWHLPRREMGYVELLDSIIRDDLWMDENQEVLYTQYYKLREVLNRYQKIKKNGGWDSIEIDSDFEVLKPEDTSLVIKQIRNRLFITGEVDKNNESEVYDEELLAGIKKFQTHNGFKEDVLIKAKHITAMNIPVEQHIKTIAVNMERCRWIPPKLSEIEKFIFVNIPAYQLEFFKEGKVTLESSVVVGKIMTKTVIFDGEMSYIAFSPYWNLPQSIIKNEVLPGMEKDEDYLKKRNMEWNDGNVRQRPGYQNSLGLVKFMFPNSNAIYLHDTPAKSLFDREDRAMSHGCIRVEKARDLAITILEEDKEWNKKRIDAAMHAGRENIYNLKEKIPVYIGYFTAWVDEEGKVNFYKDVYNRDKKLIELLSL
ncbi:MAG TPA: L,D-transpeptidase family protein [Flavobacteriaceae bacterium]|nr:L,D-transpeptidase family protein [Flavobacteriaceae bacterium]